MQPETATRLVCLLHRMAIGLGLLLIVAVVLSFVRADVAVQTLGVLVFGWFGYLARVVPRVTVSTSGMATAGVYLVLFMAGLHGFLRWFSRETHGPNARWKPRWTISIVSVVVLMFASGIATVGMVHQTSWLMTAKNRLVVERPRRSGDDGSVGHMKIIALALSNYESANGVLPVNDSARPNHSWQTRLLGFWFYSARPIDFSRPWDDAQNSPSFMSVEPYYLNPEVATIRDSRGYALSHYAGNIHSFGIGGPQRFEDVRSGLSQTMMAGEVATGFKPWGDPTNLRDPSRPFDGSPEAFGSPSGGGATVLMMDGSVRFVSERADPKVLRALSGKDR